MLASCLTTKPTSPPPMTFSMPPQEGTEKEANHEAARVDITSHPLPHPCEALCTDASGVDVATPPPLLLVSLHTGEVQPSAKEKEKEEYSPGPRPSAAPSKGSIVVPTTPRNHAPVVHRKASLSDDDIPFGGGGVLSCLTFDVCRQVRFFRHCRGRHQDTLEVNIVCFDTYVR